MIWLHYLIVGIPIPFLFGVIILVLRQDSDNMAPILKGTLIGIILPVLVTSIVAMFHVEEMIWNF